MLLIGWSIVIQVFVWDIMSLWIDVYVQSGIVLAWLKNIDWILWISELTSQK